MGPRPNCAPQDQPGPRILLDLVPDSPPAALTPKCKIGRTVSTASSAYTSLKSENPNLLSVYYKSNKTGSRKLVRKVKVSENFTKYISRSTKSLVRSEDVHNTSKQLTKRLNASVDILTTTDNSKVDARDMDVSNSVLPNAKSAECLSTKSKSMEDVLNVSLDTSFHSPSTSSAYSAFGSVGDLLDPTFDGDQGRSGLRSHQDSQLSGMYPLRDGSRFYFYSLLVRFFCHILRFLRLVFHSEKSG